MAIFKGWLPTDKVQKVVKYGVLPVPTALKGIGVFTKDGRACCEPCTSEPIPGEPGSPKPSSCVTRGMPTVDSSTVEEDDDGDHTRTD